MIRLTLFEGDTEKTRDFPGDVVTIGRSSQNALIITEPAISRKHCEIAAIQGRAILVNLAKTNGTLVNGQPVGEAVLKPGDEILIGRARMRFDGNFEAPPPQTGGADSRDSGIRKKSLHRRRHGE